MSFGSSQTPEFPDLVIKDFVFDFVGCSPPEACTGENTCEVGYEGNHHQCIMATGYGATCSRDKDCSTSLFGQNATCAADSRLMRTAIQDKRRLPLTDRHRESQVQQRPCSQNPGPRR